MVWESFVNHCDIYFDSSKLSMVNHGYKLKICVNFFQGPPYEGEKF